MPDFSEKTLAKALQECEEYQVSTGTGSPSDRQLAEEQLAGFAAYFIPEAVEEMKRLQHHNARLIEETHRWSAADKATTARAQAAQDKLALIRATATRGVPCLINLDAIDRILGTPALPPVDYWANGDHCTRCNTLEWQARYEVGCNVCAGKEVARG